MLQKEKLMKNRLFAGLLALMTLGLALNGAKAVAAESLEQDFAAPPAACRPAVYGFIHDRGGPVPDEAILPTCRN